MGKKREGQSASRRVVKSTPPDTTTLTPPPPTTTTIRIIVLIIIIALLPLVISIILLKQQQQHHHHHHQHSLVRTEITYTQVLSENMKISKNSTTTRHFNNPVLAYITPWNSQGYDMAKKFTNKFTHLSPVWYQLTTSQGTTLVLEGRHNVDQDWISQIRENGNSKILPRVVLEANPVHLLNKKKKRDAAVNLILTECKDMGYDGIVLESWSRWAAYGVLHDQDMRNMALDFVKQLGEAMHSASLELVYVIGPPRSDKQLEMYDFGSEDIERLNDAVDGFSLMTYDFSGPQNPGPNAPLQWIHSTIALLLRDSTSNVGRQTLGKKIFIGINFYGNDFIVSGGGGPIVGREYLSLLEKHRPQLNWEKNSAEHYFLYMDHQDAKHVVFYPSLKSIAMRLEEARSWGAGISIWEIGQGLEYFFDIF